MSKEEKARSIVDELISTHDVPLLESVIALLQATLRRLSILKMLEKQ
jgi:hypothetical protein